MIKFIPTPVFTATVDISLPGLTAAGTPAKGEVTFTFTHKGRKALDAWIAAPAEAAKASKPLSDTAFLAQVITDWQGVLDDAGSHVAYTPETLDKFLDAYPTAARDIYNGYLAALTESQVKN